LLHIIPRSLGSGGQEGVRQKNRRSIDMKKKITDKWFYVLTPKSPSPKREGDFE
jgi:hypothetical protein